MTPFLWLAAVLVGASLICALLCATAPDGYEDAEGYHDGIEPVALGIGGGAFGFDHGDRS